MLFSGPKKIVANDTLPNDVQDGVHRVREMRDRCVLLRKLVSAHATRLKESAVAASNISTSLHENAMPAAVTAEASATTQLQRTKHALIARDRASLVYATKINEQGEVLERLGKDLELMEHDDIGKLEKTIDALNANDKRVQKLHKKVDASAMTESAKVKDDCKAFVDEEGRVRLRYNTLLHRVSDAWVRSLASAFSETSVKMMACMPSAAPAVSARSVSPPPVAGATDGSAAPFVSAAPPVVHGHDEDLIEVKAFDGSQSRPQSVVIQSASTVSKPASAPAASEAAPPPRPAEPHKPKPSSEPAAPAATATAAAVRPTSPRGKASSSNHNATIHLDGEKKEKGFKKLLQKLDNIDKKLGGQGGLAE